MCAPRGARHLPLNETAFSTTITLMESAPRNRPEIWLNRAAMVQGLLYFVTGIWPLVHLRSFIWVTGPKTDLWLVQTVGALLAAIGFVLWRAGQRNRVAAEVAMLGAGIAGVLATCDIVFVTGHVIGPIYLLDAAAELLIVGAWAACAALSRKSPDRLREVF